MEIVPQILTAKVTHKRLQPVMKGFSYRVYYVAMPLPAAPLPSWIQSFPQNDLGFRDGRCPMGWAQNILKENGLYQNVTNIILITMPRIVGYVFNPVSFYLCLDQNTQIQAIISEVHNTFGEQHSYLCFHEDHRPIKGNEWLKANKLFHVSPFFDREGSYHFRFELSKHRVGIWIDYYDNEQNKRLVTSLIGRLSPLTAQSLRKAFWSHPLVTLKTIMLIHWQALKLIRQGIPYLPKPKPLSTIITSSNNPSNISVTKK
jgi:DUF1365 family protein